MDWSSHWMVMPRSFLTSILRGRLIGVFCIKSDIIGICILGLGCWWE